MEDFLKMDIFFAVTTAVVLVGGMVAIIALVYVVSILQSVNHLMKNVSEESDRVREDLVVLRGKIRDEGMKWKHFLDFFLGIAKRKKRDKQEN